MQAHREGSFPQAERLLGSAIDARPRDPVLRENLADSLIEQNNLDDAISQLSQAVAMSGGDSRLCVKLGRLYLQTGSWLAASEYARKALESDRKSAEAWALLAETKAAKGQLSGALADFQRALSYRQHYPDVQFKVAQIQQSLGRPIRAFSAVEQLLHQTPIDEQSEAALLLAGDLLIEMNQPAQAIEKLQIATARPRASETSYIALSTAQIAIGQPSQARLTLVQAQQRHPSSSSIAKRLAAIQDDNRDIASLEHAEVITR